MVKKNREGVDPILLGICFGLVFFGILVLASVSSSFSMQKVGNTFYYLNHQLLFGLLPGLFAAAVAFAIPFEKLRKWSVFLLAANIFLLLLVFAPGTGVKFGGAYRWVSLGPVSFQPSEFLKLTIILYLAAWLAPRADKISPKTATRSRRRFALKLEGWHETLLPFLFIIGAIGALLLLQPDMSTLGIIGLTALLMYFLSATPAWHSILMVAGSLGALAAFISIAPYRIQRLAIFLNPMLDPLGKGFQAKQALIAIGSGGFTGVGLGMSFQKFGVLPEPISDSIFAVFAEELGFLGGAALVLLFAAFAWRGFLAAKRASDPFLSLTASGITAWIALQAFVNISSMIGLIPLAGVPLPFFSYGGSALLTEIAALGLLLRISKQPL